MHASRFFIELNVVIGSFHANSFNHTFDECEGRITIHFQQGSKGKGVKKEGSKIKTERYDNLWTLFYMVYIKLPENKTNIGDEM